MSRFSLGGRLGAFCAGVLLAAAPAAAQEAALRGTIAEPAAPPALSDPDEVPPAVVAVGTADGVTGAEPGESPRASERVRPIEGLPPRWEENPFAPLGLRVGTFTVTTSLEQGLAATSNAREAPGGRSALVSESTLQLGAASDWARHRAHFGGFATFRRSLSGEHVSDWDGGAEAGLELDIRHDLKARARLAYRAGRESASSPTAPSDVEREPLRHTIDAALGVEKTAGKARLALIGEIARDQYGDARLADGTRLSQSDRDSTLALLRLRGGYELSPALIPFVEVEAGRRFYDEGRDSAGFARSATRLGARAGLALDLSEKLAGEVSVGWLGERFDDDRLESISGLALAAALDWSPERGTNVHFNASTTVEGATAPGDSGSVLYAGVVRLERAMRSNLEGDVALGLAWRDYSAGGHDLILSGEASLTWWLNRNFGLTGRARHERQKSSLAGRDYDVTTLFMGMKLQR